ncbi:MAG: ABC transporter permease [Bacteroides sp.]|nr:ABC transporter permease [Bacteroides sp.]
MRIDIDRWEEILITITRNKTRSLLTAFGIFWGIFMLVALMGGSQGMQESMAANFEGFATNSGFMTMNQTSKAYKGFRKGRWWSMELQDVERIRHMVPEVDVITPTNARWGMNAVHGNYNISCTLKGVYPEYGEIETPIISYGRYINNVDIKERRKVCVIGRQIHEALFPQGEDPCGQRLCIDGIYYQIIGVNTTEGNMNINGNARTSITIPFSTMQQNYNFGTHIQLLCYTARPGHPISEVEKQVENVVKRAHLIHPDDKQAIIKVNAEAMFSMIDNLFKGIRILSWMVGLGTLFAGAIGVSNIMMVTVKERTTEIGIRRAIGARPRDILTQILSESMVLTSLAGLAGISFGVLVLQVLESAVNEPGIVKTHYQVSFGLAIGTCLLLALLGMLAGLAPAYRAMAIKPIEAIRDDG